MKKIFNLLILYIIELVIISNLFEITGLGDRKSIFTILLIIEIAILLYWTIFNIFKDTTGIEDQTSMLKINTGTMGSGKTFKATFQSMKTARKRWLGIRVKKLLSDFLTKTRILNRFDIFYDDEEQATIEHYKNLTYHYDKQGNIVDSPLHKDFYETKVGYIQNRVIPLLFSNTSMYYEKKIKVKGKFKKQKVTFYSQEVKSLEDFISGDDWKIINDWENIDETVKARFLLLFRNKYPYLSVFVLDEVGNWLSQWESKKRAKGTQGFRNLVIEDFETFIRWIRQFGDFYVSMTDQLNSDVFKGARGRVGSITLCVAQLPCGMPLFFAPFKVFWKFSLYRRLYFKTQKNQDNDTMNETVMVTRKEDLKPNRIVLTNTQYYTSRYARTMYRDLDKPHDIEYQAKPYQSKYWVKR